MKPSAADQQLIREATEAREHAYAPYSNFRVGAALRVKDGRTFVGVNVENCSYGLTVCAERHAVAMAVAAGVRPGEVVAIAVVADASDLATPCGACRQVLAEFAAPNAVVWLYNLRDQGVEGVALVDLLPRAFSRDNIP